MNASMLALVLYTVFLCVGFGLRTMIMVRSTGATGWKPLSGPTGSAPWWGGVLFAGALVLAMVAQVLALLNAVPPLYAPGSIQIALGVALAVAGIGGTFHAQMIMGRSWRVGVDPNERTQLVTGGLFGHVRNPIFAWILLTALGLLLLVPSGVAVVAWVMLWAAVEIQVRWVEEPYLLKTHGQAYLDYAAAVGRFVPKLGLLRPGSL